MAECELDRGDLQGRKIYLTQSLSDAAEVTLISVGGVKQALADAKSIAMTDTAMPNGSGILAQRVFIAAGVFGSITTFSSCSAACHIAENTEESF